MFNLYSLTIPVQGVRISSMYYGKHYVVNFFVLELEDFQNFQHLTLKSVTSVTSILQFNIKQCMN